MGTRSSRRHKIEMGYEDPNYKGDTMRMPIANIASSGSTVSKTAAAGTTISTLTATSIQAGETYTYTLTSDASGLFQVVGNILSNKAANPPAGSYPVTITTKGSLGSVGTINLTIVSS